MYAHGHVHMHVCVLRGILLLCTDVHVHVQTITLLPFTFLKTEIVRFYQEQRSGMGRVCYHCLCVLKYD